MDVAFTWDKDVPPPSEHDIVKGLTDTDRGYFRNRQRDQQDNALLLTRAWMSERERYSADDAKEIGEVVEMCAPRFADWYHNGTLSSQRGNAKTKELARAFECRLQNYVNRKERLNGGDVIRGSVVYVVGNSEKASVCKVGTTTNPEKRFSALQVGFPWQLRVYKMYRGEGPRFEYRIHQLLDDERIRGEWFKFNEAVKEVIEPRRSVPIGELDLERWFS